MAKDQAVQMESAAVAGAEMAAAEKALNGAVAWVEAAKKELRDAQGCERRARAELGRLQRGLA